MSILTGAAADSTNQPAARRDRFEALFVAESRAILGYALRRVDQAEDAADVVAETFLVAWRRIDDVPPGREGTLWLYGVARRVSANHLRGVRRRHRLAERLREELMTQLQPGDNAEADAVQLVREAMHNLAEPDRELLQLTSWEGLSATEVASVMSIPAATVRTRLYRARNRLKAELAALGWPREHPLGSGHVGGDGHLPVWPKEES